MFRAGLELGLRKYYGGNPQHLAMLEYSEFNLKNGKFDKYLLVYDTIPGGTGYLQKLFDPTEFTAVLSLAYKSIKECNCQHNGKDGCYRCIFTYGNQFSQNRLSRREAELFFKKILDKSNAWERYSNGLGTVSGNGQIEESELEDRFIRSLGNYCKAHETEGPSIERISYNGEIQYRLKIINGDYCFIYNIKAQKDLGISENVRYNTRADFFIRLLSVEYEGKEIRDSELLSSVRGVAIYLDGYTYHASSENMRFYTDLEKRQAILESGDKISWTLTWHDLELFDSLVASDTELGDELSTKTVGFRTMSKKVDKLPEYNKYSSGLLKCRNSMERLLWYLSEPLNLHMNNCTGLLLIHFQEQFGIPSINNEEGSTYLSHEGYLLDKSSRASKTQGGDFYIIPQINALDEVFFNYRLAVRVFDFQLRANLISVQKGLRFLPKKDWELFWRVFNLAQFSLQESIRENEEEDDLNDCLVYFDPMVHSIVNQLIYHKIPFEKEGGFLLKAENTFAEAMLGFENQKIFIEALSPEDKELFLKAGYREVLIKDFDIKMLFE